MRNLLSKNRWLIAILILSVIFRIAAAFYMGNQVVNLPGSFDQISYNTLAFRVLDGFEFTFGETWWPITPAGAPTAKWSFLHTLYPVAVYYLFGLNPLAAGLRMNGLNDVRENYDWQKANDSWDDI